MEAQGAAPGRFVDGKYRLESVLWAARGLVVWRAEHVAIQRYVWLKTPVESLPPDGPASRRLVREARAVGLVAHRNVQSVVDSGTDVDGRPYVVYEALGEQTFETLMLSQPGGLEEMRAARLVTQLLEGLVAVHQGGVVHRGLSPDAVHVMQVRGGGELVKIGAFDDAVPLEDAAAAEAEPCNRAIAPVYMAPELRRGARPAPTMDVYAAGVLLRALLTGDPSPGRPLSDTARRAIERATAARIEERFQDAESMLGAVALLTPTADRPPREAMPTPSDPLAADLHYLRLRRTTRHGLRPHPHVEGRVDLIVVLLVIEAIYRRLGAEAWNRLVERVPEVESLLPGAGHTETNRQRGVPVELVSRVLAAADEIGGRGDFALLPELGEAVAQRGLRRLLPDLPHPCAPETLVSSFELMWRAISPQGQVVLLDRAVGSARYAVQDLSEPSLELAGLVAGVMRGALRVVGATEAEVYVTASQALGDVADVYGMSWKSG
ncbi:MAG: protein kinase [Myxococcota bacterium]|nr:protein kinase [Myxococcota bacterium]MDW8361799.1 protein kinase [Myxococcales bacterium]